MVRADAVATARLTPMTASHDAPREWVRIPSTASGVSERVSAKTATNHSEDTEVSEDARAARTYRTEAGPSIVRSLGIRTFRARGFDEVEVYHWRCA